MQCSEGTLYIDIPAEKKHCGEGGTDSFMYIFQILATNLTHTFNPVLLLHFVYLTLPHYSAEKGTKQTSASHQQCCSQTPFWSIRTSALIIAGTCLVVPVSLSRDGSFTLHHQLHWLQTPIWPWWSCPRKLLVTADGVWISESLPKLEPQFFVL